MVRSLRAPSTRACPSRKSPSNGRFSSGTSTTDLPASPLCAVSFAFELCGRMTPTQWRIEARAHHLLERVLSSNPSSAAYDSPSHPLARLSEITNCTIFACPRADLRCPSRAPRCSSPHPAIDADDLVFEGIRRFFSSASALALVNTRAQGSTATYPQPGLRSWGVIHHGGDTMWLCGWCEE